MRLSGVIFIVPDGTLCTDEPVVTVEPFEKNTGHGG